MKPVIIDVNLMLDLINLSAFEWLFKSGLFVYTTQEVVDHLNKKQSVFLKKFIDAGQLIVYHLSEKELEEAIAVTKKRTVEIADKSIAWLSIHLSGILISNNRPSAFLCEEKQPEIRDAGWFFDMLIENQIITPRFAIQTMKELIKINLRGIREQYEKKISEWEIAAAD